MASIRNTLFHGRDTTISNENLKAMDRFATLTIPSIFSKLYRFSHCVRYVVLTTLLGVFSASAFSAELFEVFMDEPEHLESMSSICINMQEDDYYDSELCEHAAQAIYLLKLQDLGDSSALTLL
jgi:hypothetical protein